MINGIRHTGIVVGDLDVSINFYCELLGFQIQKRLDEAGDYIDNMLALPNVKVTTVKMVAPDGQMIELLSFNSHQGEQGERGLIDKGLTHIALTVDNLEMEYLKLKAVGTPFNAPPQLSPDGFAKVTFCQAPEGTYIELVEVL